MLTCQPLVNQALHNKWCQNLLSTKIFSYKEFCQFITLFTYVGILTFQCFDAFIYFILSNAKMIICPTLPERSILSGTVSFR